MNAVLRYAFALFAFAIAACGGGGGSGSGYGSPSPMVASPSPAPPTANVNGPSWSGYARDAQHSATGAIATQSLQKTHWQTAVDLAPSYNGGALLAHYGSPVISSKNTIVVPVRSASGSFEIDARAGSNGALLWTAMTDYVTPPHGWLPPYNIALTQTNRIYFPGAGGKLFFRDDVDAMNGTVQTVVFYGQSTYGVAQSQFDANVFINTPLTVDAQGNVFFGFWVVGTNPANLASGIARVGADGTGQWIAASVAANDAAISKVATNSAPALSPDSNILYVAVNTQFAAGTPSGYLVALDSTSLSPIARVALLDPSTGSPATIADDATSSPTVGPDGDVYFGVLESAVPSHNDRGWLLHFNANLSQSKIPGSFGWDDTASIVPRSAVPSYTGPATYLLFTKYNDYAGTGTGTGLNKVAVLDPTRSQTDSISGVPVMAEVLTILAPTLVPGTMGVTEWCVNTGAVDPFTRSILVNNEDGFLYRWDLATNTLSERIQLNSGIGEAYTPTIIGPDGTVFAMNNAVLFAVGQ